MMLSKTKTAASLVFAALAFTLALAAAPARAQFADQRNWGGSTGGTSSAMTLSIPNFPSSPPVGPMFCGVAATTNTGALTLNVSSSGAYAVYKPTINGAVALTGNEVYSGQNFCVRWDAANSHWQLVANNAQGAISQPTVQTLTSGSSATYTTPAGVVRLRVRMIGGGGGGAAALTNSGSSGSDTSFGSWTAKAGVHGSVAGGAGGAGGTGGASGTGTQIVRFSGAAGAACSGGNATTTNCAGGQGGSSPFGGAGAGVSSGAGGAAAANTGSGGAGGGLTNSQGGSGGGSGEYVEFWVTSPSSTYTYTVGGGGGGGAAGTNAGGNGAAGIIIVEESYI